MTTDLKKVYQDRLNALLPLINADDKKEITKQNIVSRPTLDDYLKGNIVKIEVAHKIIEFLSKRVNQRISRYKKQIAA